MPPQSKASRNRTYYQKHKERLKKLQAAYYRRTRARRLKWQKDYASRNRDQRLAYGRRYYQANTTRFLTAASSYYRKNRPAVLKTVRAYRKTPGYRLKFAAWKKRFYADPKNRQRKQARDRDWVLKNYAKYLSTRRAYEARRMQDPAYREKRGQQKAVYMRERARRDPVFRMRMRHSGRVTDAFRRQNLGKPHSADQLIGCSWEMFRAHIRASYRDGMTDENYGKVWELDHIRPCSSFDLTKPSHIKRCFNYKNYQPLLVFENRQKSDKGRRRKIGA